MGTAEIKDTLTTMGGGGIGAEIVNRAIDDLMTNGFSINALLMLGMAIWTWWTGFQAYRRAKPAPIVVGSGAANG